MLINLCFGGLIALGLFLIGMPNIIVVGDPGGLDAIRTLCRNSDFRLRSRAAFSGHFSGVVETLPGAAAFLSTGGDRCECD